jgi:predicted MarR family transcription regulator
MFDIVLTLSEVDLGLPHSLEYFTRNMMDCVLTLSEIDLGLPHSLQYLY